jgi:hypothetical protein
MTFVLSLRLSVMILASVVAVEPMAAAMQTTIWVDKSFPGDDELGS